MISEAQEYLGQPSGSAVVRPEEFAVVKRDVSEIKSLMKQLVEATTRIALLEQRGQDTAQLTAKILERCERIEMRQQRVDIDNASIATNAKRLENIESAVREMHIEGERVKASFDTTKRLVQGVWAVMGSGGLIWVFQKMVQQAAGG